MLGIRQEDRRNFLIGFGSLMMIMAAHALGETARDTLFLSGLTAGQLPWAYLTIAGLAMVVVRANQALLDRVRDKRRLLFTTMIVSAVVDGLFWFWLDGDPQGRAFTLYVWTGLFATITVVQFWLLLDDVVHVGQAKRIFGPVAAGGVFGATVGSGLAERLLDFDFAARHLMLAAGVMLLIGSFIPLRWRKSEVHKHEAEPGLASDVSHGLRTLFRHVYLRRLLLLVLVSTVALTAVDYVFKAVVEREVPRESLGTFFARFYLTLNALALVVQLFLAGRLLRAFGVSRTLFVLPALLLASGIGFLAIPMLVPVILLKGADGSLRHSLHRTSTEVLYLPLTRALRERFKALIDGVGQRGGQALASLAILGAVYAGYGIKVVAGSLVGLLVLWLFVLARLKKPYLALFRQSLRGGAVDVNSGLMELDLQSLEGLLAALNSERDEEVLVAVDLFEHFERVDLLPKLVLYHPSTSVALRALEAFTRGGDDSFIPIAYRLMRKGNPEVRAGALRALLSRQPDERVLHDALSDDDAAVRATALVGMLTAGLGDREELDRLLSRCLFDEDPEVLVQLARAVRYSADPQFGDLLETLLQVRNPEVQTAAALAVVATPDVRHLSSLLSLIGDADVRPAARKALQTIGGPALDVLESALGDTSLPRKIRRHIPRTIHHFDPQRALDILQRQLGIERDGAVRYKILRAMGRLRANNPYLSIDDSAIAELQDRTLRRVVLLVAHRVAVEAGQEAEPKRKTIGGDLLVASLREKEVNGLERVFRLQHLLNPDDTYQLYWRGLQSDDQSLRAASRELVDHAFTGPARDAVLSLIDDAPAAERATIAAEVLSVEIPERDYQATLAELLSDPSEAIRSITAHHIAELGLHELEPQLEASRAEPGSIVAEVVERALIALRGKTVPVVA